MKTTKKIARIPICVFVVAFFILYEVALLVLKGVEWDNVGFWVTNGMAAVVFIEISLLLQMNVTNTRSFIFSTPLIRFSIIFGALSIVLSIVQAIPAVSDQLPWQIAFVVYLAIAAAYPALAYASITHRKMIETVQENVSNRCEFIEQVRLCSKVAKEKAAGKPFSAIVAELDAKMRYCEPMSADGVEQLESDIVNRFSLLCTYIDSDDSENVVAICREITVMLLDRDARCKKHSGKASIRL